jgi:DNA ligase (NAD+)
MAKRTALDLEGLGGVVADALVEKGVVAEPLDLFAMEQSGKLSETLAGLNLGTADEPRVFGEKNARKLADAVHRARGFPLSRWIHALAIPEVGETIAYQLAAAHGSLRELSDSPLLRDVLDLAHKRQEPKTTRAPRAKRRVDPGSETTAASSETKDAIHALEQRLLEKGFAKTNTRKDGTPSVVTTIGPVVARAVLDYFKSPHGVALLERLDALGISPRPESAAAPAEQAARQPFIGKTFVLTGTLATLSRSDATQLIRNAGGAVTDSISRNTDFLLAGTGGGAKRETALRLGVPILDEESFFILIGKKPARESSGGADANAPRPSSETQGLLF